MSGGRRRLVRRGYMWDVTGEVFGGGGGEGACKIFVTGQRI